MRKILGLVGALLFASSAQSAPTSPSILAPRKAGGVYVIGTYGEEQEEGVKTIDSGVKTAVFHAMPK